MSSEEFKPYRPRAIRLVNSAGRILAMLGLRSSLDPENLIATAQRKTGLHDFGDEWILGALVQLARSIDREAGVHPFGRWVIRNRLVDALMLRLRIMELVRRYPQIRQEDIQAPLVIAGLQRTGTTMLHRLLAADPDSRALLSWEAINPIRPDGARPGQSDPRIRAARMAEKGLKYLAPEFFKIHPVEAEAPEEDVLLLENSFMSQVPEAMYQVPSYARWLAGQDHRAAYEYLKLQLQLLQWQDRQWTSDSRGRPPRWVLKTPAHLEQMDVLLDVFPDARIVQTHRDPIRTVGSYSSMLAHGQGVFTDQVDASGIARYWLNKNAAALQKTRRVRAARPASFVDVNYQDLMQDAMREVERIYAFAGMTLTDAARTAMAASQQSNRKDRHGRHSYTLEDFGLDEQQVREAYAEYLGDFDIPEERRAA